MLETRSVVSLVLRCLPAPAADGFLVGHAEVVDTGEVIAIRHLDDLVAVVQRLAAHPQGERR